MKKTILFIRIWPSPPIARSTADMIRDTFPEFNLEVLDLWHQLKKKKMVLLINFWHTIKDYGPDILKGKYSLRDAYLHTPYIFRCARQYMHERYSKCREIAFTFQLQSIFDASVASKPHFVYTDHTHLANLDYAPFMKVNLFPERWVSLERSIYQHASMIFTRSRNISDSLIRQYGISLKKIACVFAGSNLPSEHIENTDKWVAGRHILFVGQDWYRKGGPDLVRAFRAVSPEFPGAVLIIVGSRPDVRHAQIQVFGRVPVQKMHAFYEQACVFCMPSYVEPFGVAFVEAMSFALPIIATKVGAIPDMVTPGVNGFLVEPGDVAGLEHAMRTLLASPETCRQFGAHSLKKVEERYNWNVVGRTIRKNIMKHAESNGLEIFN